MDKFDRSIRLPLTASVRIIHYRGISLHAWARDINRSGIGLYLCSGLDGIKDVKLEITFKDSNGRCRTEVVHGEVIWEHKKIYL